MLFFLFEKVTQGNDLISFEVPQVLRETFLSPWTHLVSITAIFTSLGPFEHDVWIIVNLLHFSRKCAVNIPLERIFQGLKHHSVKAFLSSALA
jgi:hypothetical protein